MILPVTLPPSSRRGGPLSRLALHSRKASALLYGYGIAETLYPLSVSHTTLTAGQ